MEKNRIKGKTDIADMASRIREGWLEMKKEIKTDEKC